MGKAWQRWVGGLGAVLVLLALAAACGRGSVVKTEMKRLEGSWSWREKSVGVETLVEITFTARGRYTKATYRVVKGQRRLLYVHQFNRDIVMEPEDPEALAKLKNDGYKPSREAGRYVLLLNQMPQKIAFESEAPTRVETAGGMGVQELTLVRQGEDKIVIGTRVYAR